MRKIDLIKKRAKKVSQPEHEINQQDYLNMFDNIDNGGIEEQCWAKANINKFNKSVQYIAVSAQYVRRYGP